MTIPMLERTGTPIGRKRQSPKPLTQNGTNLRRSALSNNDKGLVNGRKHSTSFSDNEPELSGELKTHIEVCARIRPFKVQTDRQGYFSSSPRRRPQAAKNKNGNSHSSTSSESVAWDVSQDGETAAQASHIDPMPGRTNSYTLDRVYGPDCTTRGLYDRSIHPLVERAMEGYHSSILAYGQTSTGKTFTMTGTKQCPGLIPLSINECFRYVQDSQESREYLIRISYLEVYKEHIRDLLAATPEPIRMFDGPNGLVLRGLKEEVVSSPEQVFKILKQGERRRQVGATHMNQHSSRSHVMVRLWIESTGVGSSSTRISSLSLVDLAGSESVKLNGTDRREEGHYINKSLMTLGQVVLSLSEGKTGHIPYRDSKLTRLLQPSLSGNAQMVLLCCISPQDTHLEESHNTFKFATRAKKVEQKAIVNVAGDEQTLLQNYKTEIEDLRKQLAEAKEQQRVLQETATQADADSSPTKSVGSAGEMSVEDSEGEVKELVEAIKTMERLILTSKPHQEPTTGSSSLDDDLNLLVDTGGDIEDDEDLLIDIPPKTPERKDKDALNVELHRIRGLLGTVLEKRGLSSSEVAQNDESLGVVERKLDFGTPPRSQADDKEVQTLRKQLEEQETATCLRKADSSFLQSQLKEKDLLLEEVSKILEAVEKRQSKLELENSKLRAELKILRERNGLDIYS